MRKLDAAISVAADYAYHLYSSDKVPKAQAIAAGVAAVVKAANSTGGFTPIRQRNQPQQPELPTYIIPPGLGLAATTLMGIGSVVSALGWIKKVVTGG